MAIVGIKSVNGKYENVKITYDNSTKIKTFESGDFVKDWFELTKFIIFNKETDLKNDYTVSTSSSVDHFIMDTDEFESAYLMNDGTLGYDLTFRELDGQFEFFVKKDERPTWQEFKARYTN